MKLLPLIVVGFFGLVVAVALSEEAGRAWGIVAMAATGIIMTRLIARDE